MAKVSRRAAVVAAIPVLVMALQLLPAPGLGNPIWASAAAALGQPLTERITIDLGASVGAIGFYLVAAATAIATVGVASDRHRAEWLLFALTGVGTLMAATAVVHDLTGSTFLGETGMPTRGVFDAGAALGVVFAATTANLAVERYETRRGRAAMTTVQLIEGLSLSLGALLVCALAVGFFSGGLLAFAAGCGFATFAVSVAVRRLGMGAWVSTGLAAAVLAAAAMIAAGNWSGEADIALRFAATSGVLASEQRMVSDAGAGGSGAGTWPAVHRLYRMPDEPVRPPPTTAARIEVEFGWPALWGAIVLAVLLVAELVAGALGRGRDSFYSSGAAAAVVVVAIETFRDASLFTPTITIVAAVTIGLGLAQSKSRSAH
ncbi:putative permease [Rhodovulum sp. PH10]|nr:putative permease [Rhodovulum sp. PH10]